MLKVIDWISWKKAYDIDNDRIALNEEKYIKALKKEVIDKNILLSSHDHQKYEKGAPLFSDGLAMALSYREWAYLMDDIFPQYDWADFYWGF